MKILFCTNTFNAIGNGPTKFANILLEVNERFKDVELRILSEDITVEQAKEKQFYSVKIEIPRFLKPIGMWLRGKHYERKLQSIRQDYSFDVVVFNNVIMSRKASQTLTQPVLGMINDFTSLTEGWSTFQLKYSWFRRIFLKFLERRGAKRANGIITNSDFLSNIVSSTYIIPSNKIYRLYKTFEIKGLEFKLGRPFANPVKVLFVKSDYKLGGLFVLLEALQRITQYQFILSVIGPHQPAKLKILDKIESESNLEVNFLGRQPQSVVKENLYLNDIFCVPSHKEALGVANIEALASGISVVSTNVGGIPEVLDFGDNGWMANPNDPSDLAIKIRECIEHKTLRTEKSMKARNYISKHFTKDLLLENFVGIIQNFVKR